MILDTVGKDLRFGARQLRKNPAFTAVAVLSLALGIGANTAIFQLVNAIRLTELPVEKPAKLVTIDMPPGSMRSGWFSTRSARLTSRIWEQIRTQQQAFSHTFVWSATRFNLAVGGEARYAEGLFVSGDYFSGLGVRPILGRGLTAEDDKPGCAAPGATISYAFWQGQLAGDPNPLGRNITLDGRQFPVIGVTAPGFFGTEVGRRYDVALPLCADLLFSTNGKSRSQVSTAWWLSAMGRLKPGWTPKQATAHLRALAPAIMQAALPETYRTDDAKKFLANKLDAAEGATGVSGLRRQYERPLTLLLAITGLVLLIACANLANLLLARASIREREIAVRQAIGASRARLVGQLMAESLLLSAIGTALGAFLAQALSRGLLVFLAGPGANGRWQSPLYVALGLDWRMLGFTGAIAVTACLLFGLLPAIRATRLAPASVMRGGGRGLTPGRERFGVRRLLVVAQLSMSLVLLVGALLFVRSLQKLMSVDTGFRPGGLISVSLDLQRGHYSKERLPAVYQELLARFKQQNGVADGAQVNFTPVSGAGWDENTWADQGDQKHQDCFYNRVSAGYFHTMGTPILAGRDFDAHDGLASTRVAVVNQEFVKKIFGGGNAVGRVFRVEGQAGKPDKVYQVVGVVGNTKYYEVREDFLPIAFLPMTQDEDPGPGATYVLRVSSAVGDVTRAVKATAASINPGIDLEFRVLTAQLNESLTRDRLMAALAGSFGLLAGVLATLGLYGVISYMVARRRNEIGVRIALGADRGQVVRLVLRETAMLAAVGLAIGTGLAVWAGRAAATLLFGLKPYDPVTLAGASILLAGIALLASYGPAHRASRLEPMQALREE